MITNAKEYFAASLEERVKYNIDLIQSGKIKYDKKTGEAINVECITQCGEHYSDGNFPDVSLINHFQRIKIQSNCKGITTHYDVKELLNNIPNLKQKEAIK